MLTSEPFHVLRVSTFSEAPVAVERDALKTIEAVRRTGAMRRLVALITADAAFTVSPFDRLAVTARDGNAAHVVVAEGDARGRSGWVPAAWLHLDGRALSPGVELALAAGIADGAGQLASTSAHAA